MSFGNNNVRNGMPGKTRSGIVNDDEVWSIKEISTRGNSVGEEQRTVSASTPNRASDGTLSEVQDQRVLDSAYHKVDLHLLIFYSLTYLFIKLSARNITNTAIINLEQGTGIKHQLGNLTSEQWAWILSIFYYPYMAFEPLSTVAVKWFRPSRWMSRITLTWGIIAMCQAATQNFAGLFACRFLLGLAEAGLWPAVLYHLSFWYPADRMPLRIAGLYACGQLSGTFSGLLAFGIAYLNDARGLSGWRWVFILEGIPSNLLSIASFFCLPDYPDGARFLSREEHEAIIANMPENQPTAEAKTWDWEQVKATLRDPIFYTFLLIWVCLSVGGWGVAIALPNVIFALGLEDTAITQLMTMPPYTVGCVVLLVIAWLIHKKKMKAFTTAIVLEIACCVCYIVLLIIRHAIVKYVLVCLTIVSAISIAPILWPERIRAAQGTTSTGLAIGITSCFSHLAGIVGPQIYQSRFGPTYGVSYAVSIGLLGVCVLSTLATWILMKRRKAGDIQHHCADACQDEEKS